MRPALIVDDEPAICWCFEQMLGEEGITVATCSTAEEGLRLATELQPALIVLDVRLPGMDGLSALPKFAQASPDSPVIIITAFGDLGTAVQAVKRGAADYLTKPFGVDRARAVCRTVLRQREVAEAQADAERHQGAPGGGKQAAGNADAANQLVGRSPAMQEVYRKIAMVAESDLSVLITGETGTGKELIAAAIHQNSPRRDGPYLAIAPVALSPTLVESELFGHVKGAFTGADDDRAGLFGLASGGTVFLDEIGDLPMAIQVKLLRVLEQRQYTPVGDVRPRDCNVRVLAATNTNMKEAIAAGEFREDLYYRLAAVEVHAPPLRERLEDLELLVQHFLRMAGHASADQHVAADVLERLAGFPWPGNVRQLRNVVEHAAVMSRGGPITIAHITPPPASLASDAGLGMSGGGEQPLLSQAVAQWTERVCQDPQAGDVMNRFLAAVEPTLLAKILEHTGGNRAAAADLLGIHRGTLRDRLRRYGIDH